MKPEPFDNEIGLRTYIVVGGHSLGSILNCGEFGLEASDANDVLLGVFKNVDAADDALFDCWDRKLRSNGGNFQTSEKPHPMLAAALDFAMRDWDVFPAPPGEKKSYKSAKHSNGAKWGKTRDPEQIRKDFDRWPEANIGIPTGADNKIWVLETDTPEGHNVDGDASLTRLEQEHGPLPTTLMAESPSRSRHRYYNWPKGAVIRNSSSRLGPGIDVRGEGGMVIAPPSVRGNGEYRWLNDNPIVDAPQWLIDLAVAASGNSKTSSTKPKGASMFNGQRPAAAFAHLDPNDSLGAGIDDFPPLPFEPIKAGCGWLREAHETGGKDLVANMPWNLLTLCATFMEDGHELAHQFSNQHPDYDFQQTEALWERKNRERKEQNLGWPYCKTIHDNGSKHCESCPHFAAEKSPLHLGLQPAEHGADAGVKLKDFYAYMPMHNYIFAPSREMWPASSVNARIPRVVNGVDDEGKNITIKAGVWIDKNQPVEMMTWAPGLPMIIADRLIAEGGWIERKGVSCFNLYRPPTIRLGDAAEAKPWVDLVRKVYPNDADHIIKWFACRVRHPEIKINHGLFLGSQEHGIGKDTILEGVKRAVGAWNFKEVAPKNMFEAFNPWRRAVILRVSEAKDMGDVSRFELYDGMKTLLAAPPDVLECNEKHIKQHYVLNCVGVVITSNHLTDGIYLPAEDRRHYVAWSDCRPADFAPGYWPGMWKWYEEGGDCHVAAYLATLDISDFDPKAAPPKTPAFWSIVNANRTTEEGELQDILDKLGNPDAVTIDQIVEKAPYTGDKNSLRDWLGERKNRKAVNHRLENCGYRAVNNPVAKDGLWRIDERRQMVYAKTSLSLGAQLKAAQSLPREAAMRKAAEKKEQEKRLAKMKAEKEAQRKEFKELKKLLTQDQTKLPNKNND